MAAAAAKVAEEGGVDVEVVVLEEFGVALEVVGVGVEGVFAKVACPG